MAYDVNNVNRISSGKNTGSFTKHSYLTEDTILEITDSTYLDGLFVGSYFKNKDIIEVVAEVDALGPSATTTTVSYNAQANKFLIEEENVILQVYLGAPFFASLSPVDEITYAPFSFTDFPEYIPLGFSYMYDGVLGTAFDMEFKIADNLVETFEIPPFVPGIKQDVFITAPISFDSAFKMSFNIVGGAQASIEFMHLTLFLKPSSGF